jgi:hypothetical protein
MPVALHVSPDDGPVQCASGQPHLTLQLECR